MDEPKPVYAPFWVKALGTVLFLVGPIVALGITPGGGMALGWIPTAVLMTLYHGRHDERRENPVGHPSMQAYSYWRDSAGWERAWLLAGKVALAMVALTILGDWMYMRFD